MRTLFYGISIETLWWELCHTTSTLSGDVLTQHLAPPWNQRLADVESAWQTQRSYWREENSATARIFFLDFALDEAVETIASLKLRDVRMKNRGYKERDARESPEFTLYFQKRPFEIVRMGLESELVEVEGWPAKLAGESDSSLAAMSITLGQLISQGKAAITAREKASSDTALFRVRTLNPMIDALNTARCDLYAELIKIANANRLPRNWPEGFFLSAAPAAPARGEARGKAQAILGFLQARQLSATPEEQERILSTTDLVVLDRWIVKAATATAPAELFG
jgi:hypothetical protein